MPKKRARGGVTGSSAPAPKRTRFATTSQAEDASTTSSERPQRSATKENSAMKAPTTRGRGRPPKSRTPSETPDPAPPATRGRGRPRQSSTPRETPGIAHQNGIPEDASTEEDVKSARKSKPKQQVEVEDDFEEDGTQYWLMKAEPDSRIENGKDVAFSIDMLRDREEPEPWDGVRNPVARNNMRAMKKGDLAFFYHSNCKKPGIVGIMEIAQEHTVDESAFDSKHPYYDPKSSRDKPKWELVHVKFVRKFDEPVYLPRLRTFAKPGGVLEKMQVLIQSRLSVSSVKPKEWKFIMSLVADDDKDRQRGSQINGADESDQKVVINGSNLAKNERSDSIEA